MHRQSMVDRRMLMTTQCTKDLSTWELSVVIQLPLLFKSASINLISFEDMEHMIYIIERCHIVSSSGKSYAIDNIREKKIANL